MHIYPSLMACNLLNIQEALDTFETKCDGYHIDIMDGHFVPNVTWGPASVNAIRHASKLPIHLHLMVENPLWWLERISLKPLDTVFFHQEVFITKKNIPDYILYLQNLNIKAGIALSPDTSIEEIDYLIGLIDSILIMSVYPGFSGQVFIPSIMHKIEPLLALKKHSNKLQSVGIDGGITVEVISKLAQYGIDFVAVASAIFQQQNPVLALQELYRKSMPYL